MFCFILWYNERNKFFFTRFCDKATDAFRTYSIVDATQKCTCKNLYIWYNNRVIYRLLSKGLTMKIREILASNDIDYIINPVMFSVCIRYMFENKIMNMRVFKLKMYLYNVFRLCRRCLMSKTVKGSEW